MHGRGPALYAHLTRHGLYSRADALVRQLYEAVAVVEAIPPAKRTFGDLERALGPALTLLDTRRLALCEHDPVVWLEHALAAVSARFPLPADLRLRVRALAPG